MILNSLSLSDFGPYEGRHEFLLAPERGSQCPKNVILFGGRNGAGKTTLLEAVRLTLHGRRALGPGTSQRAYDAYLKAMVHRPKVATDAPKRSAEVQLSFSHSRRGLADEFVVKRFWSVAGDRVREELLVSRAGKILTEVERDHWEKYLLELFPPGVTDLQFFDADKIRTLADENRGILELQRSVGGLLGLDLVERLRDDLALHLSRKRGQLKSPSNLDETITALRDDIEQLQVTIQRLYDRRTRSVARAEAKRSELESVEIRLAEAGGLLVDGRERLERAKEESQRESDTLQADVRSLCAGLLPFAMCPQLCTRLRTHLEAATVGRRVETLRTGWLTYRPSINAAFEEVLSRVDHIPAAVIETCSRQLSDAAYRTLVTREEGQSRPAQALLALSDVQAQSMVSVLSKALGEAPSDAADLATRLERSKQRLRLSEERLAQLPADDAVQPLVSELRRLSRQDTQLEHVLRKYDERVRVAEDELKKKLRSLSRFTDEMIASRAIEGRAALAVRIREILPELSHQLRASKVADLRSHLRESLQRLASKQQIHDVCIDPTTLEITLFDQEGRDIPQERLSKGERQVYALAILWALALTSRRQLPMIIDSPLGRLDREHRRRLCESYFPVVSDQVIILSTDTELDEHFHTLLRDRIARSYTIEWNESERRSDVRPGYFFG